MAEYIERDAAKDELLSWAVCIKHPEHLMKEDAMHILDSIPAADVVPKGAYDQVAWERDIAIQQLREDYGVGLGEKKAADVVEVAHGRWEFDGSDLADIWKCSACGDDWFFEYDPRDEETRVNYCPNCGADMRVSEEEKLESHSKAYVTDKNVGHIIPVNDLYDEDGADVQNT